MKISNKIAMTIEEAAEYSNIGASKLRDIINTNSSVDWILHVGNWIRVKRIPFEKWLLSQTEI